MPAAVPPSAPACVAATQIAESDVYVPVPQIVASRAPAGHATAIRVPAGRSLPLSIASRVVVRSAANVSVGAAACAR